MQQPISGLQVVTAGFSWQPWAVAGSYWRIGKHFDVPATASRDAIAAVPAHRSDM